MTVSAPAGWYPDPDALSGAYKAAGITASVLAGVSVINSVLGMLNG